MKINDVYRAIRPLLQRIGLLGLARRLMTPQMRAQVAQNIGLGGYIAPLPPRAPYRGAVRADGVNYIADLRADIGVGESARGIYDAMRAAGIAIHYQEIETPLIRRSAPLAAVTNPSKNYGVTLAHLNPPELHLGVERYPDAFHRCYTIGYWLWEVPRFPERWLSRMAVLDELWTSSRYTQNILSQVTNLPVIYMPIPVTVAPQPVTHAEFGLPEGRFIFFFAFNPGSSVARKNPYGVIEAYRRAFLGMENAPLLVIKAHHLSQHPTIADPLREAVRGVKGILIEDHLTRSQMHGLTALADCVVSLHRAEGFGLLIAEAMALGRPVIATGYSSNMDFMTPANSFPVRYTLRDITTADHHDQPLLGEVYAPGQLWAEPDLDHAAELMQYVINHPAQAHQYGAAAQHDLTHGWSAQAVGHLITERLNQIAQRSSST